MYNYLCILLQARKIVCIYIYIYIFKKKRENQKKNSANLKKIIKDFSFVRIFFSCSVTTVCVSGAILVISPLINGKVQWERKERKKKRKSNKKRDHQLMMFRSHLRHMKVLDDCRPRKLLCFCFLLFVCFLKGVER